MSKIQNCLFPSEFSVKIWYAFLNIQYNLHASPISLSLSLAHCYCSMCSGNTRGSTEIAGDLSSSLQLQLH